MYTEKLFCNTVDRLEQIVLGQASPETTFRENKSAEKSQLHLSYSLNRRRSPSGQWALYERTASSKPAAMCATDPSEEEDG